MVKAPTGRNLLATYQNGLFCCDLPAVIKEGLRNLKNHRTAA